MRIVLLVTLLLLPLLSDPALALTDAQKCSSFKWKVAGGHAECLLKEDAKAIKTGKEPDYSSCERKLTIKYTRAELKWACDVEGEVANVGNLLNTCTEGVRNTTTSNALSVVGVSPGWTCTGPAPDNCEPICGDSLTVGTEFCDDGNTTGSDGCSADCLSGCGDGLFEPAEGEECDDGNSATDDGCTPDCIAESCGDGVRQASEACDDFNNDDGDGCSADCQSDETCGNGVVDAVTGEECDDGGVDDGDGCSAVCEIDACKAASFDGLTQFATIPDSASLNPSGSLSLMVRVKSSNSVQANRGVAGKWNGNGFGGTEQYVFIVQGEQMGFALRANGTDQLELHDTTSFTDGAWHSFAFTWDGATAKLYRDGAIVDESPFTGVIFTHSSPFEIGRYAGGLGTGPSGGNLFEGEIDDVHLWDRALSAEEVGAYHTCNPVGDEADLLAYWALNEGAGVSILDRTANANHGSISSELTWEDTESEASCACGLSCELSNAEWIPHGDGTVTHCSTGLMWEMKTDDGSVHDNDNTYTWSGPSYGTTYEFDGTAKTAFIDALNAAPCFAGYCDWRLPTHSGSPEYPTGEAPELESLLIEPFVCGTSPCTTIPGETVTEAYWSSVTGPTGPTDAWIINFDKGAFSISGKSWGNYVRAVRDPS